MKNKLTWDRNTFYLDGEPFRIIAGDIHYFRIHQNDWGKRLDLAVDFGLNAIQTYVPWNAHEPRPGEYCFEGMLDLGEYLRLAGEKGLRVLLRPSPYICSEWDFGGLPSWLLADRELIIRSRDARYLAAVRRYYKKLFEVVTPYLATHGGPVIAVAIENEYGSYGNDHAYIHAIAEIMRENGVDVPFYTTDGALASMVSFGRHENDFFGVNYRATVGASAHAEACAHEEGPNAPYFVGEFWAGRSSHWGEPFFHRPPEDTSRGFAEALALGGHVCFYMFSGGTNFGYMGGANDGPSYSPRPGTPHRYIPFLTTYDVDALIGEDGVPREKYYLCREELDRALGREVRPRTPYIHPTQSASAALCEVAPLFDNLDALTAYTEKSLVPKPMEDYGQNYGLILYSTDMEAFNPEPQMDLWVRSARDRVNLYCNGKWHATYMRDRGVRVADGVAVGGEGVGARAKIKPDGTALHIDALVENLGRVNYGPGMGDERKGLDDCIHYRGAKLFDYTVRGIQLEDLSGLAWQARGEVEAHKPCFFRGSFEAKANVDTYVNFAGFGHGYIFVNGINLGRFDGKGPQMSLYCPGSFLVDGKNSIVVLDIDPQNTPSAITLADTHTLVGESEELT